MVALTRTGRTRGSAIRDADDRLVRSTLAGVAIFRWLSLAWLIAVQISARSKLGHPLAVIAFTTVAGLLTIALTLVLRDRPRALLRSDVVATELAVGLALIVADGWVYEVRHSQSLGAAWPLAGILAAGIAWGWVGGGVSGLVLGLGRVAATKVGDGAGASALSLISTCVLYAQVGGVAGYLVTRLRTAERQISIGRAREEVARTLHDGVLQTLAVVQRRSTDPGLADLARRQERELRDYLFGFEQDHDDLSADLRALARRFEEHHGGRAELVIVEEPEVRRPELAHALCGAVGEALTNAGKHGEAGHVVIYVEPGDDELFVSVKDDGRGFDPGSAREGVGIGKSIRGRMDEVGGRVRIDSVVGHGTEVQLWVPTR